MEWKASSKATSGRSFLSQHSFLLIHVCVMIDGAAFSQRHPVGLTLPNFAPLKSSHVVNNLSFNFKERLQHIYLIDGSGDDMSRDGVIAGLC